MEKREIQSSRRYLLSIIIGTFIFIVVFLGSYSLSYLEFQRISNLQGDLAYTIFEDKLAYSFFDKGFCSEGNYQKISEDLGFQGRIIDDLEKKLGKNNLDVLARKKFYTLIELEHLEFVKNLNENCNLNMSTILFFYSNDEQKIDDSENIGKLISVVVGRNSNLVVYSFDVNLNSTLIDSLKKKYNIDKPLTLIINEKSKVENPQNINEIEQFLK
jgi:hypothetical protein